MKIPVTKYIFIGLALFALWIILPVGDYKEALFAFFLFLLIAAILVIIALINIVPNVYYAIKGKQEAQFTMPILLIGFLLLSKLIFYTNGRKFWTSPLMEAEQQHLYKFRNLTLYKNNSFTAKVHGHHASDVYQGDFTIKNDTLHLDRDDIFTITGGLFTDTYFIDRNKLQLIPMQVKSDTLHIETIYN